METYAPSPQSERYSGSAQSPLDDTVFWAGFASFTRVLHANLELDAAAFVAANEGRQLTDCDRLTVLVARRDGYEVQAVSGVDTFDGRSATIQRLECLAERIAALREPLWYDGSQAEVPPQLAQPLQAYIDESHVRSLAVLPLLARSLDDAAAVRPVGVLVFEQFREGFRVGSRARMAAIAAQAEVALRNARQIARFPFVRRLIRARLRDDGLAQRRSYRALAAVGVLCMLAAWLVCWPTDLTVRATGQLQPRERRDIFAPRDGLVVTVHVQHGQQVQAGETLLVLQDPELDLELRRIVGQMQAMRSRLETIQSERVESATSRNEQSQRHDRLTAEGEELKELLISLQEQYELVQSQRSELTVTSPLDGQVITWDVRHRLANRPVRRGQRLLTVADTGGAWSLDLEIPDDRVGFVSAARREQGAELQVRYTLATSPGRVHRGRLATLGVAARSLDGRQPTVPASIILQLDQTMAPAPGATALAKIFCGRRPLGYVWWQELAQTFQRGDP